MEAKLQQEPHWSWTEVNLFNQFISLSYTFPWNSGNGIYMKSTFGETEIYLFSLMVKMDVKIWGHQTWKHYDINWCIWEWLCVWVARFWWQRLQQANKPANATLTVQTASHSLKRHAHQVRQETQSKYKQFVRKNCHSIFIKTTEVLSVVDMKSALLPGWLQQHQAETEPNWINAFS